MAKKTDAMAEREEAELRLRAELAAAGCGDLADRLVRSLVRARTAPRQRTPTEVIAPYLETMTFKTEEGASKLYEALGALWNSIDRETPRPAPETAREKAEDLLEAALAERDKTDDLRRIRKMLRTAVESDPGWWESQLELADIEYHGFQSEDAARVHYGRALDAARKDRPAAPDPEQSPEQWTWSHVAARPYLRCLEALGDYHVEKGEWDKGRRLFERLLRHDPSDPLKVRARLAEARERGDDEEGAIELYRGIVKETGASEPAALYALGRLLLDRGETAEGRRTLWRAGLALPWAAAALLDHPFEGELDPDEFPEIEWIEIGLGYAERTDDLWRRSPEALHELARLWRNPTFSEERSEAIELAATLMEDDEDGTGAAEKARKRLHSLLDPARIAKAAG